MRCWGLLVLLSVFFTVFACIVHAALTLDDGVTTRGEHFAVSLHGNWQLTIGHWPLAPCTQQKKLRAGL